MTAGVEASDVADVQAHLERALAEDLVSADGRAFRFSHPLIRHACYSALPIPARQRRHARVASLMMSDGDDPDGVRPIAIAHHLIAAGGAADPAMVARWARLAGDRTYANAAWSDAARYYEAALRAGEETHASTARERGELHFRAGLAYYRDQDAGPCVDQYEQAIAAFRECDDAQGLARALMGRTRAQFTLVSVGYGVALDTAALEEVAERLATTDPVLSGFVRSEMSQVFWTAREPERARALAADALATAERHGADILAAEAHRSLALASSQLGDVRATGDHLRQGLACARRAGDSWLESQIMQRVPLAQVWTGDLADAERAAAEAGHLTERLHDWGDRSLAEGALACIATARGDFDAVEAHARQALTMCRRSGYPWAGPTALMALAQSRALRGAWAEADDALDLLATPGQVFTDPGPAVFGSTALLRMLIGGLADGSDAHRRILAERTAGVLGFIEPAGFTDLYAVGFLCALVELAECVGRRTELPEAALCAAAERGVVFSTGWVCLVPRVLGVAAALQRRLDDAVEWFARALPLAEQHGARTEIARTALAWARVLTQRRRRGDLVQAGRLLARATPLLRDLGMTPLAREAATLAERLATRVPRTARAKLAGARPVAPRDLALLQTLASGRPTSDVARALVLHPESLRRRRRALLRRLGFTSVREAIAWAREHGHMPADPTGAPALVIILFTDLVGSTSLYDHLGDAATRALVRTHDRIVREALREHRGDEVKHTGDGVMAVFRSVHQSVACARDVQRAIDRHNRTHAGPPVHVRIGLNAGEPLAEDGDLFGTAVTAAARICAHAKAGHILAAEVVQRLAEGKAVAFVDRGRVVLRGFRRRFHLFEIPW